MIFERSKHTNFTFYLNVQKLKMYKALTYFRKTFKSINFLSINIHLTVLLYHTLRVQFIARDC